MRGPELVDELAEGARFLDRAKVRALQVLDEGELELVATRKLSDDGGHPFQAGHLCGAYATLSGDELVSVEGLGHHDRLQDAVLADADRKLLERFLKEIVRAEPSSGAAYFYLSTVYTGLGHNDTAYRYLEAAMKANPGQGAYYHQLGVIRSREGCRAGDE